MSTILHGVDAFTDEAFAGNPAAVCLLDTAAEAEWMQRVAREMNLSETAFVVQEGDGWNLRWFTPTVEVKLCGHATLAAAFVLRRLGAVAEGAEIRFATLSGPLCCRVVGSDVEMNFPAHAVTPRQAPAALRDGLGATALFTGDAAGLNWLVEVESAATLRALTPDFARLATLPVQGIIVTARSDDARWDFLSRFFAPASGIPEDPVTGSAHCALGPYWSAKLGRSRLTGFQCSARGGTVGVELVGDRVLLRGAAVLISQVELFANPAAARRV
jgi:PhzF family phenazine biosynthesis protein